MYREAVYLILGILLMMSGRQLFWLFVGGSGFVLGMEYTTVFLQGRPEEFVLIASLVMAIVGLVLAIAVQRIGVGIAGFIAGGYSALTIINKLGVTLGWVPWAVFIAGGVIGVILVVMLFDWALVILSSLIGTLLIIGITDFNLEMTKILFIFLFVIGIIAQASQFKQSGKNGKG